MTGDRLRGLPEEELGTAIRSTTPAWPDTPPLQRIVAERLRESERLPQLRPRLSLHSRRRTVLILVAAALLVAAAAVAARLVVEIGAASVEIVPGPPTGLPERGLSPQTLGEPAATLHDAAETAGFAPIVPARLGAPEGIWTAPGSKGGQGSRIVLAWRATPALPSIEGLPWGAVLMEFRGEADLAAKRVFEESLGGFRPVAVEGGEGFWITGAHAITLEDPAGGPPVTLRVTGNVLLWQRGDLTMRLESSLGLPAALEVAASIP